MTTPTSRVTVIGDASGPGVVTGPGSTVQPSGVFDQIRDEANTGLAQLEAEVSAIQAELAAATPLATPSTLCERGPSAECAFGALTSTSQTVTDADASITTARSAANVMSSSVASGDAWHLRLNTTPYIQLTASGTNILSPNQFNIIQAQDAGATIAWAFGYCDITGSGPPGLTLNTADTATSLSAGGTTALLRRAATGRVYTRNPIVSIQTSGAGPHTNINYTMTADTLYGACLSVVASNDTDNEAAIFGDRIWAFKRVGATGSSIGAQVKETANDFLDATMATANVDLTYAGGGSTIIGTSLTGVAGKTISWNVMLTLRERVIA